MAEVPSPSVPQAASDSVKLLNRNTLYTEDDHVAALVFFFSSSLAVLAVNFPPA